MNKEKLKQPVKVAGEYLAPHINVYETEVWPLICMSNTGVPMGPEIPMYD